MKDNRKKLRKWREQGFIQPGDAKREIDIITNKLGEEVQAKDKMIDKLKNIRIVEDLPPDFVIS